MRKLHSRSSGGRRPLPEPSITSHILVATRGSDGVSPEIRVARALVERHRSMVDVVSVVSPMIPPPLITDVGLTKPVAPTEPLPPELAERRQRIRQELGRAGCSGWNATVVGGWPADEIPAMAERLGATLIVMGIGRHAPIDRLIGSETALQIIHTTSIPILAVARDVDEFPRHALAALDFSEQSQVAARQVAELLGRDGALMLAHVRSDLAAVVDPGLPVDLYATGVQQRLDDLERRIKERTGGPRTIERVVRHGDAVSEILHVANVTGVDLIAVGAQPHSRAHRLILGSVAAKLLRAARCSVLVIPEKAERARRARQTPTAAEAVLPPPKRAREPVP